VGRFRSNKPKSLKEALKDFLDDYPHRKRLKRGMILSLWEQTVGEKIAKQTENIHFEHGNLVIHVKNPAWRQEIHMKRFSIAKKLNDKVEEKIVKEIVVRS
jgi:predicted nucleic acid-binding Zn ribbon protein